MDLASLKLLREVVFKNEFEIYFKINILFKMSLGLSLLSAY